MERQNFQQKPRSDFLTQTSNMPCFMDVRPGA